MQTTSTLNLESLNCHWQEHSERFEQSWASQKLQNSLSSVVVRSTPCYRRFVGLWGSNIQTVMLWEANCCYNFRIATSSKLVKRNIFWGVRKRDNFASVIVSERLSDNRAIRSSEQCLNGSTEEKESRWASRCKGASQQTKAKGFWGTDETWRGQHAWRMLEAEAWMGSTDKRDWAA